MKKIKYIKYSEDLCFKCLNKKEDIKIYTLEGRGYGSIYDNVDSKIQLCPECRKNIDKDIEKWFNERPNTEQHYLEDYKYEKDISQFIKSLPIQGRELFENQISYGAGSYNIDSQDWIDMELEVADDIVYTRNSRYSPAEIKAYHDRFPTCKHTYLKIYPDGSGSTICKYNSYVFGNEDGSCDINICTECYYCNNYEKRNFDKYKIEVEKTLNVDYKVIDYIEVFCPTCGHKILLHKNNFIYNNYDEEFCCGNCHQSLHIDTDKLFEKECY